MSSHRFPITVLLDSLRARFVRRRGAAFFLLAVGLAVPTLNSPLIAAPRYRIVALDPLPVPPGEDPFGYQSFAYAISESGVVAGESTLNTSGHIGQTRPVMWTNSSQAEELWDDQNFGGKGLGINNAGFVVGRYGSGSGIPLPGPGIPDGGGFIWNPVTREFSDLGDLGGFRVEATGINELGQVAGSSENFELAPRAFIWDAVNGMRDLGTLDGGGGSRGTAINNTGKVVGWSLQTDGTNRAFIWDPINGMQGLGWGSSRAFGINDHDQVVGLTLGDGVSVPSVAFLWDPIDGSQAIGSFVPSDINSFGQVVGQNGSIWDSLNGLRRLENLLAPGHGWQIWDASAINDSGQIAGYGRFNDDVRAFVATPVPEPEAVILIAYGCFCLLVGSPTARNSRF